MELKSLTVQVLTLSALTACSVSQPAMALPTQPESTGKAEKVASAPATLRALEAHEDLSINAASKLPQANSDDIEAAENASLTLGHGKMLKAHLVITVGGFKTLEEIQPDDHRPRVLLFYAQWCELSDLLGKELIQSGRKHAKEVNFVAVDAENPKYAQIVARFGADILPLMVFIDEAGDPTMLMQGYSGPGSVESGVNVLLEASDQRSVHRLVSGR